MLTGLYPRQHGARSNFHAIYPETDTIGRALSDAGYQTGAFTSTNIITQIGELNRGFQADNLPKNGKPGITSPQPGQTTLSQLGEWLDTLKRDKPVFLFLHVWEPHEPYQMTDWGRERMGDYDGFLSHGVSVKDLRQRGQEIKNSEANVAALQALYSGEVHAADAVLGLFFEDWKDRGLLDNTVFIFTADHGQGLGEQGRMGHGPSHYEHVIRVPMIISDFRAPSHQRVETRVGTIDISPTIAELAGVETKFDWIGYSLLQPERLDPEKPYFVEVELRTSRDTVQRNDAWYDPNAVGVWAGGLKLISRHDKLGFFETYADNRFPEHVRPKDEPIMFNYLSGLIDTFRETALDLTSGDVSEDELKQLRGLGYVQ
jgi:arylsulfatase A-like enzyme